MEGIVESTLRGRDEVEFLQTEEVRYSGYVVRENMLPEAHDTPDVAPFPRAILREVELFHDLREAYT